jgi:hypothetical protein
MIKYICEKNYLTHKIHNKINKQPTTNTKSINVIKMKLTSLFILLLLYFIIIIFFFTSITKTPNVIPSMNGPDKSGYARNSSSRGLNSNTLIILFLIN